MFTFNPKLSRISLYMTDRQIEPLTGARVKVISDSTVMVMGNGWKVSFGACLLAQPMIQSSLTID